MSSVSTSKHVSWPRVFPGTPEAVGKGLGREARQDRHRAALGHAEKSGNEGTGQAV